MLDQASTREHGPTRCGVGMSRRQGVRLRQALSPRPVRPHGSRAARLGLAGAVMAGVLLFVGCAAPVPPDIRTPEPTAVSVSAARAAPSAYIGTPVRWGGSILAVRNDTATSDIEILARPLTATGEPEPDDTGDGAASLGRFIARFAGFLDPAAYPEGRLLTVAGTVADVETRDVGEYPYRYPVVRATGKHLWPEPVTTVGPYPSPWYDPWYGYGWPGWGYGPWYGPGYGPGFGPWYRPWYW